MTIFRAIQIRHYEQEKIDRVKLGPVEKFHRKVSNSSLLYKNLINSKNIAAKASLDFPAIHLSVGGP